ncbi:DUF5979 domain-containing protein [Demequina sp. NBRC 110051]|uniref:DUF5979 domain-containing protein n=1 Tax=Demequina sp. NBRC 110051 TaxID=1570340 RepID=UPI001356612D|nr:DUF5979 domain-containing protein [Demequina sp. NBRC 110051]
MTWVDWQGTRRTEGAHRYGRKLASLLLALLVVATFAAPARAEGPAGLTLTKSVSQENIAPGDEFLYTIQISCVYSSAIPASGCTDATVTDILPPQFHLTGPPQVISSGNSFTVSGDAGGSDASVSFTTPLDDPEGGQGMLQGTTATIQIPVVADALTYDDNGVPIINEAEFTASNPDTDPDSDTATVIPEVPLVLDTDVEKSFTPDSALAAPGSETTIDITASNESETGADEMVIVEPADPTASPNPFDSLAITDLVVGAFPADADLVQVDVYTDSGWVNGTQGTTAALPGSVDPDDILGVRITFSTSSDDAFILPGSSVDIAIDAIQRDLGELASNLVIDNTVSSTVERDDETATDSGDASYTIEANIPDVTADKSFDPVSILHGETSDATLVGGVAGDLPVEELSIIEPSATGDLHTPGFDSSMSFEGFASAPVWPAGATDASVTYYCADGTDETVSFADGDVPGEPSGGCEVARFSVDFTGLMDPGASATVVATVGTDADDPAVLTPLDNEMTTTGTTGGGASGSATDDDTLYSYLEILTSTSGKSIVPSDILGEDGEWTVLELAGGIAGRPDPGADPEGSSTGNAQDIVVQDPIDPAAGSDYWDAFNPDRITNVVIPPGATLTVNYWDGDSWEPLVVDIPSSESPFSYDIAANAPPVPGAIGGLQFVFHSDEGFPPGTTVYPNIVMDFDGSADLDLPLLALENCTSSSAETAAGTASDPATACDTINVYDPEDPVGPGVGDLMDKNWLGGEPPQLFARSGDQATARITWSTGGYSNADAVTITDVPGPPALADSVYDAFDLVRIDAITPDTDPYIEFDAVEAVLLYNQDTGTWAPAANSPCGDLGAIEPACTGQLPQISLTAAERETTTAVQFVFVESPARASSTDPAAPPVGSGVARSINNTRPIDLVFELRDWLRSDASIPATGHTLYNDDTLGAGEPDEGLVWNQAQAVADFSDRDDITDTEQDEILILDDTLGVSIDKTWTDNEVGIPPVVTDADDYPHAPISLTVTNTSANAAVDTLALCDGTACSAAMTTFEYFNFDGFTEITMPTGATGVTVTLTDSADATVLTTTDIATALAWTGPFGDVTNVRVEWEGRIEPGASATVSFGTILRKTIRTSGEVIDATDAGTVVTNVAFGTVDDAGRNPDTQPDAPIDQDDAQANLVEFEIGLTVDKTFGPTVDDQADVFTQTEPDQSEFLLVLRSQPFDGARPAEVVVSDVDPTFWNVYEFVRIDDSFTLQAPVDQIQMSVLTGQAFSGSPGGDLTVTGGTTVNGGISAVPTLPAAVAPAEVQGVVFTMNRADGDQWEGPVHPIQEIPIVVQRRDEMLSGGEPPTDLLGNQAAPGEDEAGHSIDTVTGYIESYLDTIGGDPLVVDAEPDDAEVIYEHSRTAVGVEKTPAGTVSPGSVIPYTLTFTNTGDTPIYNPVFTDTIPTDGDGPLLQIDPSAAETGDSPYGFALSGTDPDAEDGLPLPTDEAEISITEDPAGGSPETITFSFADGYVLGVGQTYTITVHMVTRPALLASTTIENTASVEGDRPFDACNAEEFDPAVPECDGSTQVIVAAGGAIRAVKQVKADDPSLGTTSAVEGAECIADEDGFYSAPCIPISPPGTTETWRLDLENTGNVPLDQLTVVDRMPDVGDLTALENFVRDSEWHAEIVDPQAGVSAPLLFQLDVYGTTETVPCADDLVSGPGSCPDGVWVPIEDFGGDYADVTGLKYEFDFRGFAPFRPGQVITVDIQTRTPLSSPTDGPDTIAWNTVAAGAVTTDGEDILPTEGNKIGVALATGPLSILKTVSGEASSYAPDTLTVELVCTVDVDGEPVEAHRETLTLTPGEELTIEDLPYGAQCHLEEGDNGQTDASAVTATVDREDQVLQLTSLDNVYDEASLLVSKNVVGSDASGAADPADAGPFPIWVRCDFLGEQVWADGYGPVLADGQIRPMLALLSDDEEVLFTGLPAGAECTITELLIDESPATVSIVVTTADGSATVDDSEADLTLTPDDPQSATDPGTTNTGVVTNTYELGSIVIDKQPIGPGADDRGNGPFIFHVECTFDRPLPLQDVTTYDGDIRVGGIFPLNRTISGIVVGSECIVTETDDGGAEGWLVGIDDATPSEPQVDVDGNPYVEVTVDDSDGATVVAQDIFEQRVPLDITKAIDESVQDQNGDSPPLGPFTVELVCVYGTGTVYEHEVFADGYDADNPMVVTLAPGETVTLEGLPSNSDCVLTETDVAGAASTTITVTTADGSTVTPGTEASFTLPAVEDGGTSAMIDLVNAYPVGSLLLNKQLDGDGADSLGSGPFTLHVRCVWAGPSLAQSAVVWDGDVVLGGDEPLATQIDGIVAGSVCVVTEPDAGGADYTEFSPGTAGGARSVVTIVEGGESPVEVVVTNRFEALASLAITKEVEDSVANADGEVPDFGPYVVAVRCVYTDPAGDEHDVYADDREPLVAGAPMVVVLDNGETVTLTGLPSTSECTVTELVDGGAVRTTVTVTTADAGAATVDGTSSSLVLTEADTNTALVTNTFAVGALAIEKVVGGGGAAERGAGPFEFSVLCTWERGAGDPVTTWSGTVTLGGDLPLETQIDGIAAGSECVVTETDSGGADDTRLTPAGASTTEAVVTIGAGTLVTVVAYNQFDATPPPAGGGEDGDSGFLPISGFDDWAIAIIALALLAAGAVIAIIARRKR